MTPDLDSVTIKFIRVNLIDSYQKLHVLLFFQQNPNFEGTCRELAQKLHLADTKLVSEIIIELSKVELIVPTDCCWKLHDKPEVVVALELLARAFEQPLTRQQLLDQLNPN